VRVITNKEIEVGERVFILLYGTPGVGKSFFLGTIPGVWIISTLSEGEKVWGARDFKQKYPKAEFHVIEIEKKGWEGWLEVGKAIKHFKDSALIAQPSSSHLAIDSWTDVSDMALDYALYLSKHLGQQPTLPDYGTQTRLLKDFIMDLRAEPFSIWITGHEDADKDEVTGAISRHPMSVGKFARMMGRYFDACFYYESVQVKTGSQRRFVCQPAGITVAKNNLALPQFLVDPDYAKLMEAIRVEGAPLEEVKKEPQQELFAQPKTQPQTLEPKLGAYSRFRKEREDVTS